MLIVKKLSNYRYYCQSLGDYTSLYKIGEWIYNGEEVYVEENGKDVTQMCSLKALVKYREKYENSKNSSDS
jgi:hypothetical protein